MGDRDSHERCLGPQRLPTTPLHDCTGLTLAGGIKLQAGMGTRPSTFIAVPNRPAGPLPLLEELVAGSSLQLEAERREQGKDTVMTRQTQ